MKACVSPASRANSAVILYLATASDRRPAAFSASLSIRVASSTSFLPVRSLRQVLRDGQSVLKVIDSLVVGRSSKRTFASLHPVRQRKRVLLCLDIVLGDEFGLGDDEIGILVDQNFGYGFVIMPAPSAQKRLVRRILNERVAKHQRVPQYAADDDDLGGHELLQRVVNESGRRDGRPSKEGGDRILSLSRRQFALLPWLQPSNDRDGP